jgi:hypothetical protein
MEPKLQVTVSVVVVVEQIPKEILLATVGLE